MLRTNLFLKAITYGQGKFVGTDQQTIYTSADGIGWRPTVAGDYQSVIFDLTFAADRFVAVGPSYGIGYSTNGTTWSTATAAGPLLHGVIYGDGKFVAVGDSGIIWLSETLAESWTIVMFTNVTLWAVAYGAGNFVAVGDTGTTFLSTNGRDWARGNIGTNASFYDVTYANGLFVAVGVGGRIYTSADGMAWTARSSGVGVSLFNVVYHNGTFLSAGVDSIVSSPDGQTWVKGPQFTNTVLFTAAAGNNTFFVSGRPPTGSGQAETWQSSPLTYTEPAVDLPGSVAVPVRGTLRLNAQVRGTLPMRLQWRKDEQLLPNATNEFILKGNAGLSDAGSYRLEASNELGTNSASADVVVGFAPVVVSATLPIAPTVTGATALISATVTGTPPFTFIWRRSMGVTTAVHMVTGSNDFLRISPVLASHAGTHGVIVTNLFGTNLRAGTLVLEADNDGDGLGDAWEFRHGLDTNNATDASLDLDGDLHSNLEEFIAGTIPTNALSVLRITNAEWTIPAGISFDFTAASNTTYMIETKEDSGAGNWTRVRDVTAVATNRVLRVFEAAARTNAIFRVRTPWEP